MTTITPIPTPVPSRTQDAATFVSAADATLGALPQFVTETNIVAGEVQTNRNASDASASAASTSANNAAASASAASSSANAGAWVNTGVYSLNQSAISQINFATYRKITAISVTTIDPANDPTNWVNPTSLKRVRVARTNNTQLVASDTGKLIDITSGSFTQTLASTSSRGNGWTVRIKNSGTGDIGITTDGVTYFMYPGEVRDIICDGTSDTSTVIHPFYRVWTSTATNNFTKPPGYSYFGGLAWSGGASGQKSSNTSLLSLGGPGGGCFPFSLPNTSVPSLGTVTVGAGGASVSSDVAGNAGGETSVLGLLFVCGGTSTSANLGGMVVPTTGVTTANLSFPSGLGFDAGVSGFSVYGGLSSSGSSGAAGKTSFGGACGGSLSSTNVILPTGISASGGNGGTGSTIGIGVDGSSPGGGGGASRTAASGNGARGEVRMWGIV